MNKKDLSVGIIIGGLIGIAGACKEMRRRLSTKDKIIEKSMSQIEELEDIASSALAASKKKDALISDLISLKGEDPFKEQLERTMGKVDSYIHMG